MLTDGAVRQFSGRESAFCYHAAWTHKTVLEFECYEACLYTEICNATEYSCYLVKFTELVKASRDVGIATGESAKLAV